MARDPRTAAGSLTWQQRLDKALQVVGDLPEYVDDVLAVKASSIADEVQGEVVSLSKSIMQDSSSCTESLESAAAALDGIPEMIFIAFEASFRRAKEIVRNRIAVLAERLEQDDMDREQIVDELWLVPEEVQTIVGQATEEAMQSVHEKLTRMLDQAMISLPDANPLNAPGVQEQLAAHVVGSITHTVDAAKGAASGNIRHAVAAVQEVEPPTPNLNKEVADALMRAKVDKPDVGNDEPSVFEEVSQASSREFVLAGLASAECAAVESRSGKMGSSETQQSFFTHSETSAQVSVNDASCNSDCPLISAALSVDSDAASGKSGNSRIAAAISGGGRKKSRESEESRRSVGGLDSIKDDEDGDGADGESKRRLSIALAAIDALPEQLARVLQSKAYHLASDLRVSLAETQTIIKYEEAYEDYTQDAVRILDMIPGMVLDSFEYRFLKVNDDVRQRVNLLMREVKDAKLGNPQHSKKIVRELLTIPEEVQNMASAAVEAAVQESQDIATNQLVPVDQALSAVGEDCRKNKSRALNSAKRNIMARVPAAYSETIRETRATAATNVLSAIEAVDPVDEDGKAGCVQSSRYAGSTRSSRGSMEEPNWPNNTKAAVEPRPRIRAGKGNLVVSQQGYVNQATASALSRTATTPLSLQHNAGGATSSSAMVTSAESENTDNPGSRGHPELCPRPCLYFTIGECKGGSDCYFCHMPHPKRPAHLDRSRRDILKSLPVRKRFEMIMPVLQSKMEALNMPMHVLSKLEDFSIHCVEPTVEALEVKASSKDERMLYRALNHMTVRSLLATLLRTSIQSRVRMNLLLTVCFKNCGVL